MIYSWQINEMFAYPEKDGKQNVVFGISYTINGEDDGDTASIQAQIPMPLPSDNFTPYDQLTEEQVIDWVKGELGDEQVAKLEAQLAQMVSEQKTPSVVVNPLPWAGEAPSE